jgi:uncharacterized protein (UPF0548 family)
VLSRTGHTRGVDQPRLTADQKGRLRGQPLTYGAVGSTRGELPGGYQHLRREAVLGSGEEAFGRAVEALFSWELQRRAGVRVVASGDRVTVGADAILRLGFGRLAVEAPVRVVYVVDEPRRQGFAYGTLPGHPESGEEAFVVTLRPDEVVVCRITAFSRPATRLARIGGPLTSLTQRWVTKRYLRSLRTCS